VGILRRAARWLLDAWAMGGVASMGGPRDVRTGHPMQTRVVADSMLSTVRDADEQRPLAHAVWSLAGALALGTLGVLQVVTSLEVEVPFLLFLGAGQALLALAVVRWVLRRRLESTWLHAAGIALAGVSVVIGIVDPTLVLEVWALPGLLLGIGAVIALAIGRR
jgi:hypothetical protein